VAAVPSADRPDQVAVKAYPKRAALGLALFIGQAFIYNGVTFNLGTLLTGFFDVSSGMVPLFIIIWALGNFAGPITLGRLFDTVGRKPMISGTYIGSAVVAVVLALYLAGGGDNKWVFLAGLVVCFFMASSGASAAYLTVSEIFPMETRALAIAFFYAIGTAIGGISGPLLFSRFIASGDRDVVSLAFYIGAGVMALAGVVEIFLGVKAEQANLEDLAQPLTSADADSGSDNDGNADSNADDEGADKAHQGGAASGPGKFRPGPGRGPNSPWVAVPGPEADDRALDQEIEILATTLHRRGPLGLKELSRESAATYWGPGRFRRAVREGIAQNRIARLRGDLVGPVGARDGGHDAAGD
jgi:hypothetical protein